MTWSFRRYLALLIATIALPLCALLAFKLHELARAQYGDAERIAQGLAENQAVRIRTLFENTQRIAALISERPLVRKLDRNNCDPLISELLQLPQMANNISVLDTDRRFICSAVAPRNNEPVRWHSGFAQAIKGLPGLSGPVRGALDQSWIMAAAHPVPDSSGKVAGVVTVTINLQRLSKDIADQAVWPGTRSTVIDPEDIIIARSDNPDAWIGKAVRELPAISTVAGSSTPLTLTGMDGVERIYASAPVNDKGWRIITGIPVEALLARERTDTRRDMAIITLIIMMVAATAAILARQLAAPVRNMDVVLRRIAAGDRDARVPENGPREIAELARRFNAALEHVRHAGRTRGQLSAIVESSNDAILSRDLEGRITFWNKAAERMFGWTTQEAIGMPVRLITPADRIGQFSRQLEQVRRGEPVQPYDTERLRKDGSRFHAQISLSSIKDENGQVIGIATIVRDITERRIAEEKLRALALRLSEVEELERRNIHRELHDQVGASLSALKIDLGLLRAQLQQPDNDRHQKRLTQMQQLLGETIGRIRNVMSNLRPPDLDDYGLVAALRTHADAHAERLGIPVIVSGEYITPRPSAAVETALFRIAQEALNNMAKHARAKRVEINLSSAGGLLRLSIDDNGIGFADPPRNAGQRNWGLETMRERALGIGAELRIESAPGRGTRIIVELPVEPA